MVKVCREGIDMVTLKVALRHSADRLEQEMDHLRQWSYLASNVGLDEISSMLGEALEKVSAGSELLGGSVRALAELQVRRPETGGPGVTVTPV
ncbi:MAG: hypothetical protein H5T74_10835 [Actinobacteria bacterium]|nr:hypothetical protein [Actinomycetota bacterium]